MVLPIIISNAKPSLYLKQNIGGLIMPNISSHNYDIFLMKNPKSTTKEAIAGYDIFIICILISSIVMIIVVKEGLKKKNLIIFDKN